jgi:hypothetical protein
MYGGKRERRRKVYALDFFKSLCYNGFMKNRNQSKGGNFKPFSKLKFKKPEPKYPHYTEANAVKAGESAFKIRVPFYNNPYKDNPFHSAWIRGFKRAEREFNEGLRRSARILETIALEEVEA